MSFMSRLKGVFDVKMGQKEQNLRKNTPKTAKITTNGHTNQTCCFITSDTQRTLSAEV